MDRRKGIEALCRNLGAVGWGDIGKQAAHTAVGLGMKVGAFSPHPEERFHPEGFRWVTWEERLAHPDILSLRCPSFGKPIIDHQAASHRRKGANIVDMCRAGLVDEEAVLEALQLAQAAGSAMDVYIHDLRRISPPRQA